jgi:hypothetical protein
MANFNTHLIVASTVSGIGAVGLLGAGVAEPAEVMLYFSAGTLGGLLPDLDSDNSVVLKLLFGFFAVFFSFLAMFTQARQFAIAELLVLWLSCFLILYFGVFALFKRLTVHRGIFHSIPMGILLGLSVTILCHRLFHFDELVAWLTGVFILLGFLVHLILDEIYSVDLRNVKIKKSWGSAMKVADAKNVAGTIILYLGILALFYFAPSTSTFVNAFFKGAAYTKFQQNLLPEGRWFSGYKK